MALAALALLAVIVANAWVGDDAMITVRTVDSFVNGHGLRYNVAERVLTNVHPLWMLFLSPFYAVTREPFFTVIGVGLATTAAAILVLIRGAYGSTIAALALLALATSKAFVDYSTSGLENPLSYLLLAIATNSFLRSPPGVPTVRKLALLMALGTLARMDVSLLFAPMLALAMWQARARPRAVLVAVVAGLTPLLAWELFSFVY